MMIFNCARMDALKARALAGDRAALKVLLRLLPADIPGAARNAERAAAIRRIAAVLQGYLPDLRPRPLAETIAAAGDQLASGRDHVDLPALAGLPADQLAEVEAAIRDALAWYDGAPDTRRWLSWRQIWNLVK